MLRFIDANDSIPGSKGNSDSLWHDQFIKIHKLSALDTPNKRNQLEASS